MSRAKVYKYSSITNIMFITIWLLICLWIRNLKNDDSNGIFITIKNLFFKSHATLRKTFWGWWKHILNWTDLIQANMELGWPVPYSSIYCFNEGVISHISWNQRQRRKSKTGALDNYIIKIRPLKGRLKLENKPFPSDCPQIVKSGVFFSVICR